MRWLIPMLAFTVGDMCWAPAATAGEAVLPPAVIASLPNSIRCLIIDEGAGQHMGSATVVAVSGDRIYLVTARHQLMAAGRQMRVVIANGAEHVIDTTLIANDETHDLALLSANGAGMALTLAAALPTVGTQMVASGFPDPVSAAGVSQLPPLTTSVGHVTELKSPSDNSGELIRFDADINYGSSGGAVLDATGSCLGIVLRRDAVTRHGEATPASAVRALLEAHAGTLTIGWSNDPAGKATLDVEIVDPLQHLSRVELVVGKGPLPAGSQGPGPTTGKCADSTLPILPLALANGHATGQSALPDAGWWQTHLIDQDGHDCWSAPRAIARSAKPAADDGDWLGKKRKAPVQQATTTSTAGQARDGAGFHALTLTLEATKFVPEVSWLDTGSQFALIEKNGTMHRIGFPGGDESARLEVGHPASGLALSAAGLLAAIPDLQQLWVIDPATLTVRKQIPVPNIQCVGSDPQSQSAWVATPLELVRFDLAQGRETLRWKVLETLGGDTFKMVMGPKYAGTSGGQINWLQPARDGKHLVYHSHYLTRIRIDADVVSLEERSIGCSVIGTSSERNYIAIGSGNAGISPEITQSSPCVYFFHSDNLLEPVLGIQHQERIISVAFDRPHHRLIMAPQRGPLLVCDARSGKVLSTLDISKGDVKMLAISADGNGLIAMADDSVQLLTITGEGKP